MIVLRQTLFLSFIYLLISSTNESFIDKSPLNPLCIRGAPSLMDQYIYTKDEFKEIKKYLVLFSFFIGKYKDYFSFDDAIRHLVGSEGIFKHVNWMEDHDFAVVFVLLEDFIKDADRNNDKNVSFCEFYNYEKSIQIRNNNENRFHELYDKLEGLYIYHNISPQ